MNTVPSTRRRALLGASASALASIAGCTGSQRGSSDQGPRQFDMTITRRDGELAMAVEPAGDAPGVVTVSVGDTVSFDITNDADVAVGLHDHVTDSELVLEQGGNHVLEFSPTESTVGRHAIEGYPATEDEGNHGHGDGNDSQDDGDHGHDGNHSHDSHHETTDDGDHHEMTDDGDEESGHAGETVTLLTVEVRPESA